MPRALTIYEAGPVTFLQDGDVAVASIYRDLVVGHLDEYTLDMIEGQRRCKSKVAELDEWKAFISGRTPTDLEEAAFRGIHSMGRFPDKQAAIADALNRLGGVLVTALPEEL